MTRFLKKALKTANTPFKSALVFLPLFASSLATAQDFQTISSVETLWKGSAEVGGSITTGNSRSENVYLGGNLSRTAGRWTHGAFAAYDYGKSSTNSAAMSVARDKGLLGLKSKYRFTPRLYGFGALQGERDRVASIKYRTTEAVGLGYRFIDQPALSLDAEAGPAYRQTQVYNLARENEFAVYASANLDWQIAPAVNLTNRLSGTWADSNTALSNEAALNIGLSKKIGARFSHSLGYNSDPVIATNAKVDTTTRASLVFGF